MGFYIHLAVLAVFLLLAVVELLGSFLRAQKTSQANLLSLLRNPLLSSSSKQKPADIKAIRIVCD